MRICLLGRPHMGLLIFISSLFASASAFAFLQVMPSWVNFGSAEVGSFGIQRTIWVQNSSQQASFVNVSNNCFSDFNVQTFQCQRQLQPNETCSISASFQPRSEGYKSCSITLYDSTGIANISLSGQAFRR